MLYITHYQSPIGEITLGSDGEYLTALYFSNSKDCDSYVAGGVKKDLPIFVETARWLDIYFRGCSPDFTPRYRQENLTTFRQAVAEEMLKIPYGQVATYGDLAEAIAKKRGLKKMSAQAIGGAVGWNPICIIVPCHRVVGANGNLTGYGGGIENKIKLLVHEGVNLSKYFVPKNGARD